YDRESAQVPSAGNVAGNSCVGLLRSDVHSADQSQRAAAIAERIPAGVCGQGRQDRLVQVQGTSEYHAIFDSEGSSGVEGRSEGEAGCCVVTEECSEGRSGCDLT